LKNDLSFYNLSIDEKSGIVNIKNYVFIKIFSFQFSSVALTLIGVAFIPHGCHTEKLK